VFYARCYVELHKPELCVYICKELTQIGFQNSTYILLLQARAYETGAGKNLTHTKYFIELDQFLELQLARTCCEDARTIDPFNLDSMDVFSNILFVLVCVSIEHYRSIDRW
jgi:hypothetical protein